MSTNLISDTKWFADFLKGRIRFTILQGLSSLQDVKLLITIL